MYREAELYVSTFSDVVELEGRVWTAHNPHDTDALRGEMQVQPQADLAMTLTGCRHAHELGHGEFLHHSAHVLALTLCLDIEGLHKSFHGGQCPITVDAQKHPRAYGHLT